MKIHHITGSNFSGKSRMIHKLSKQTGSLVLPANAYSSLTGLSNSASEEISFSASDTTIRHKVETFLSTERIDATITNPALLSGGQQVLLATVCELVSSRTPLMLDHTLEQLSTSARASLLEFITTIGSFLNVDSDDLYLTDFNEDGLQDNIVEKIHCEDSDNRKEQSDLTSILDLPAYRAQEGRLFLEDLSFVLPTGPKLLSRCSFEFTPGVLYILRGDVGIGKSTLAKLITGVIEPTSGSVLFESGKQHHCGELAVHTFQDQDKAFIRERIDLELTCTWAKDMFRSLVYNQDLSIHPLDLPLPLRKILSILKAAELDRGWYIFDEPFLYLDRGFRSLLLAIFEKLIERGRGVLVISHTINSEAMASVTESLRIDEQCIV